MRSNRLVSLYPVAMGQTQRPAKRGSWRGHSLAWGAEGTPPTELPPTVGGAEGSGHCSGCGGRSRLSQGGRGRSSPCARAKPAAKVHSGPSPPRHPPLPLGAVPGGTWVRGGTGIPLTLLGDPHHRGAPDQSQEGGQPPRARRTPPTQVPFPALGGGIAQSWGGAKLSPGGLEPSWPRRSPLSGKKRSLRARVKQ